MKIRMKANHHEIHDVEAIDLRIINNRPHLWMKHEKGVYSYYSSLEWEEVPESRWKPMAVTPLSQGILLHDVLLHQQIELPLGIRAKATSSGAITFEERLWRPASFGAFAGTLVIRVGDKEEVVKLPDTIRVRYNGEGVVFDKKESV